MEPITSQDDLIMALIRHLITIGSVGLAAFGIFTGAEITAITGAVTTLANLAWVAYARWNSNKKVSS